MIDWMKPCGHLTIAWHLWIRTECGWIGNWSQSELDSRCCACISSGATSLLCSAAIAVFTRRMWRMDSTKICRTRAERWRFGLGRFMMRESIRQRLGWRSMWETGCCAVRLAGAIMAWKMIEGLIHGGAVAKAKEVTIMEATPKITIKVISKTPQFYEASSFIWLSVGQLPYNRKYRCRGRTGYG